MRKFKKKVKKMNGNYPDIIQKDEDVYKKCNRFVIGSTKIIFVRRTFNDQEVIYELSWKKGLESLT